MMDITVILEGIRVILGFFLLLFVPGFTISLVYFPYKNDLPLIDRLIYSTVLSIGSVIVLVLFMDLILGIYTTPRNISIIICAFSVFALILWQCEKKYQNSILLLKMNSRFSNDYIALMSYIKNSINKLKDYLSDRVGLKERIKFG